MDNDETTAADPADGGDGADGDDIDLAGLDDDELTAQMH